jgi:hypothetical protein
MYIMVLPGKKLKEFMFITAPAGKSPRKIA